MQKNNIRETLCEVRALYRLLYNYQRRIMDLVGYIGSRYGLTYNGGYSKFSNTTPRNGRGNLGNWAWDWLNMYYYEFNFYPKEIEENTLYFSVFILSDTGYYKAKFEGNASPTNTSNFKPVDDSQSEFILVAGKNMWYGQEYNWDKFEFILEMQGFKTDGENKRMFFKHYNLEDFESEELAIFKLIDFQNECKRHGIPLSLVE